MKMTRKQWQDVVQHAFKLTRNGQTIEAIKFLRRETGCGIKEAHDAAIRLYGVKPIELLTVANFLTLTDGRVYARKLRYHDVGRAPESKERFFPSPAHALAIAQKLHQRGVLVHFDGASLR